VVERDPIVTAKCVASVDVISGGRMLFGVGAGWNLEEMRNHGTDPARRFGLMRERIEAMNAIWTQDEASYHGRHVDFDAIWCWPKPVQKPHPPVLVGGGGPRVLDRVLAYGDEWMPNRRGGDDALLARIAELRRRGRDAGRGDIPVTLVDREWDPRALARYEAAGVHRAMYWVPGGDRPATERGLDELAAAVAAYGRRGYPRPALTLGPAAAPRSARRPGAAGRPAPATGRSPPPARGAGGSTIRGRS
jgi:probable F420-dependent oxidoreductase